MTTTIHQSGGKHFLSNIFIKHVVFIKLFFYRNMNIIRFLNIIIFYWEKLLNTVNFGRIIMTVFAVENKTIF